MLVYEDMDYNNTEKYGAEVTDNDLLNRYGAVLEICSAIGLAYPEDFLPDKKEKIEVVLIAVYRASKDEYCVGISALFVR